MPRSTHELLVANTMRRWLTSKGYEVVQDRRALATTTLGKGRVRPDLIAANHTRRQVVIIECEIAKDLRTIAHAFGRVAMNRFTIEHSPEKELLKNLVHATKNARFVYAVAFQASLVTNNPHDKKETLINAINWLRDNHFKDIMVYLVTGKNQVQPVVSNIKPIPNKRFHRHPHGTYSKK